jgi:hypothetical protein
MSQSYYDSKIKGKKDGSFYNWSYPNEFANHQVVKNNTLQYNFRNDLVIQSKRKVLSKTPTTMVYYVFNSGSYLDYKIPFIKNGEIDKINIQPVIQNEHASAEANLPSSASYMISKVVLMQGTNDIGSQINSDTIQLYNALDYDELNKTYIDAQKNDNFSDGSNLTLASTATMTSYIRLPLSIDGTMIYRDAITEDEQIIRIYFRSPYAISGVADSDLKLLSCNMHIDFVEIPDSSVAILKKQPFLDYRYIRPIVQSYKIGAIASGTTYTVSLTSYNSDLAFAFIWLEDENKALADLEKKYLISSIHLTDEQNNSIQNNLQVDQYLNRYLLNKFFPGKSYIQATENKLFLANFCYDPSMVMQGKVCGSFSMKGIDFKLEVKAGETVSTDVNCIVMFFTYAYLRVSKGVLHDNIA